MLFLVWLNGCLRFCGRENYLCTFALKIVELKEKDNMEELSFDNILGGEEIETLFSEPEEENTPIVQEEESVKEQEDDEKNNDEETTEVVNPEDLFEEKESKPESVGSGNKKEGEKGDTTPDEDSGTSPINFYSSIAQACAVDGIFPNLDEETVKKADSAEALGELMEAEVNARLDEKTRRVSKALENGVEPDAIKRYENTLNYIASITDAAIAEESDKGEQLRRNLIYQDFLNKGYSPEKAQKFTERTIDAGTDIEDAKEALQGNKEFFQNAYNSLLQEAQQKADEARAERQKQADRLKDSIMKDKQLFGDMELSNEIRKKAYDNIAKPVYKDPETGEYLTALQKYEMENRSDFLKYAGLIFTLTNGFKDFESFTKGKVKKEVRKGLRELEQTLNNTRRNTDGSLRMVTRAKDDPESFIGKGIRLDF